MSQEIEPKGEKQEIKEDVKDSPEEILEHRYIELTEVEDYYGDKSRYKVYVPIGNSNEDGLIFYSDHGFTFATYT